MEAGKRVLIADDDAGIRHSLARIMRCKGLEVETACDGRAAVDLSGRFAPDLLLLDIRMPEVDGVEAFEQIRATRPEVTAILMTAYSSSGQVDRAIQLGALSVLPKPLDIDCLGRLVDVALQRERADQSEDASGRPSQSPPDAPID